MVPELRYQSAVIGAVALAVVTQEAKRQVGPRRIWNVVLSVEALTLAFGTDRQGLPLPVHLMAPMGAEAVILQLAAVLERDGRWQHRFPIAGWQE